MKLIYLILGSLCAAFSLSAIPNVDNFPNKIHRTQPASEADTLRFELCPIGYVSSDADLMELCKGVR